MTRKHFTRLAWALRVQREAIDDRYPIEDDAHYFAVSQWQRDVKAMSVVCAESNPRFDRDRFFRAAGFVRRPDGALYAFNPATVR